MMRVLGVDVTYALSPQATGKVERPYQWLQDRIVRTCALERISALEDIRAVLREEVHRYNHQQAHSTTKEIPSICFNQAKKEGSSLFRPLSLPKPYTSPKDVFCLREARTVNGYRRISLFNHTIEVPKAELYEEVKIHWSQTQPSRSWRLVSGGTARWCTQWLSHSGDSEFTFEFQTRAKRFTFQLS
jgi:hypothetical protein